jgi:hypothetical protein
MVAAMVDRFRRTVGQGVNYRPDRTVNAPSVFGQPVSALSAVKWLNLAGGAVDLGCGTIDMGASPSGGTTAPIVDLADFEFEICFDVLSTSSAVLFCVKSGATPDGNNVFNAGNSWRSGCYLAPNGTFAVVRNGGGSWIAGGTGLTGPLHVRMRASGADVIYDRSSDGGLTWTRALTDAGALTGAAGTVGYGQALDAAGFSNSIRVGRRIVTSA